MTKENKSVLKQIIKIREEAQSLIDQSQRVIWKLHFLEVHMKREEENKKGGGSMKNLVIICLCFLFTGCAYISHTVATMKASDVNAIASGVPIGVKDGDVLFERTMEVYIFRGWKEEKKEVDENN